MKMIQVLRWQVATGFFLLLATSCEIHSAITAEDQEEMIAVQVNLVGVNEGESEEVMRSASVSPLTGRREIAMTSQLIGNGMLVDMSLEPDEVVPLRGTPQPLETGKKFRVIALDRSTHQYVSHGDFTVGGPSSVPSLHVRENVAHDFVCLSYNSTTKGFTETYTVGQVPANLAIPNTDDTDLLYANMLNKTITSAANASLSFTLTHKLSKVTLMLDATYNGWNISGIGVNQIRLSPFYAGATMNLQNGSMVKNSAATNQYFAWNAISPAQTQTSKPRTVFTNGETISLTIPQHVVTINGNPHPSEATTFTFPSTLSLVPGNSYTLRLRFRQPRWAGSNIYWDHVNSTLTFDTEGITTHEGYQGVFFKWGSLVGISPAQTGGSNDFSSATPVYWPVYNATTPSASYFWDNNLGYDAAGWPDAVVGVSENANNNIPYMDGSFVPPSLGVFNMRFSTFLMDADRNTTDMYWDMRGDICQYLSTKTGVVSGNYRLPMAVEFARWGGDYMWAANTDGWVKGGTFSRDMTLGNAYGTTSIIKGNAPCNCGYAENTIMGGVVFPASGFRWTNGTLAYMCDEGDYWSGSISQNAGTYPNRHLFVFLSVAVGTDFTLPSYALPIRCVRN
jgi:hypothetical protein